MSAEQELPPPPSLNSLDQYGAYPFAEDETYQVCIVYYLPEQNKQLLIVIVLQARPSKHPRRKCTSDEPGSRGDASEDAGVLL